MNCCDFDVIPGDAEEGTPETAWHYERVCEFCGTFWYSVHCPHDGAQGRCPACLRRPTVLPA